MAIGNCDVNTFGYQKKKRKKVEEMSKESNVRRYFLFLNFLLLENEKYFMFFCFTTIIYIYVECLSQQGSCPIVIAVFHSFF